MKPTGPSSTTSHGRIGLKKKAIPSTNKPEKMRVKPSHPRTADMVNIAIKTLKEHGGSSLQAIKKYIHTTYGVDVGKQAPFIKKYLKTAVSNGSLVQTKGTGAAGSFKLSIEKTSVRKMKKKTEMKTTPLKKSVTGAKKPAAAKKSVKVDDKKSTITTATQKRKINKGPAAKPPKVKVARKPTPKKSATERKATLKAKVKKSPVKKVTVRK